MVESSEESKSSFEDHMNRMWEDMNRMMDEMNRMWEGMWGRRQGRTSGRRMLSPGEKEEEGMMERRESREPMEYRQPTEYREPLVDVFETDDEVIVTAEIPGLDKDDIKIFGSGNRLEILAEKTTEVTKPEKKEKEGEGNYIYKERSTARFYRSVTLPATVIPDKAKSSYKHGILEVRMPKAEVSRKTSLKIE